ncbi:uncharacterized protein L969DRAFT_97127 [Mixia osmundae IAM 14324]|uniref:Chromosome segregation in meiosis protein n=1 Tax=Mixia osmundae (strain CBS 9802 / IAM 14324 / JCM 22182 / KY 12970) TaxID=764103 RepID=G7E1S0_MIXOS|nr:uncharacterized protein L969DRAFT_97127 [Mixia osmundae IAM 14324]KEI36729.1 hypothetical protein L969DRAFT_97127 [Mixia osmundae IAM 14324]GAA96780.1 hypothetical protein E5Q_03451 [Mixia osmundae IAM 14324]
MDAASPLPLPSPGGNRPLFRPPSSPTESTSGSPARRGSAQKRKRGDALQTAESRVKAILARKPRYLGDSDLEDESAVARSQARQESQSEKPRRSAAEEIDRLFAGLSDDEDIQLPPQLDVEAIRARARAGQREPSPAPPDFGLDDLDALGKLDEVGEGKEKKKRVKMDTDRLLSAKGLVKLKESAERFKIKGKGHEMEDLKRLLSMYTLWAHQMNPMGSFHDTISRCENLCKTRLVVSQMKEWRSEFMASKYPSKTSKPKDAELQPNLATRDPDESDVEDDAAFAEAFEARQFAEKVAEPTSVPDDIAPAIGEDPGFNDEDLEMDNFDDFAEAEEAMRQLEQGL